MTTHAERVRALRRKAESTPFPGEAQLYREKALELEALYGAVADEEPRVHFPPWAPPYPGYDPSAPWGEPQRHYQRHAPAWDWPGDPGPAGWYRVDVDGQVRLQHAAGPAGAQSAGFQTRFRR